MLTPLDIHNREFRHAMRGYREDEVDDFLDQVVRDFEILIKENHGLKERLAESEDRLNRYKQIEETLQSTLIIAQETAEEVRQNARKEADLIIREAEESAKSIIAEGEAQRQSVELQIAEMKRETEEFRGQIRGLLQSHIALLDRGWDVGYAQSAAGEAEVEVEVETEAEAKAGIQAASLINDSSGNSGEDPVLLTD